jgi:hypothetical protein
MAQLLRCTFIQHIELPSLSPRKSSPEDLRGKAFHSEAWKRFFELQSKQTKVTYAQAAASHHSNCEMSTQTDLAPLHLTLMVQRFTTFDPGRIPK